MMQKLQLMMMMNLPTNDWVTSIETMGGTFISTLQRLSPVLAGIIGIVAGLIYMSSDKKADMAKGMWFRIAVSLVVIFSILSIVQFITSSTQSAF